MNKPDQLRLTMDQNPSISEAYGDTPLGEKIKFEVEATLKARDGEGMDFTIEAVIPEGFEKDDDSTEPQMPGGLSQSDAMMTPAAMMVRKKQSSPKAE